LRHRIRVLLLGQTPLVGVVLGLHAGVVCLGVLLLHELFDEREPLADVLGLGLDFRNRELSLDVYFLELQGVLVRVELLRHATVARRRLVRRQGSVPATARMRARFLKPPQPSLGPLSIRPARGRGARPRPSLIHQAGP
jgi:hypothetical protein